MYEKKNKYTESRGGTNNRQDKERDRGKRELRRYFHGRQKVVVK